MGLTASIVGAEVGAPLVATGTVLSGVGTLMEVGYSISNENYIEAGSKFGIWLAFSFTGGLGASATKKVAGKEFVEQGLNNTSEAVIQGINMGMEKAVGKGVEDNKKKK